MTINDLIKLYEKKKQEFREDAYKHISELLTEAKKLHKKDWLAFPTPNKDHEQSWRAFKGKNLEALILFIIKNKKVK